MFGKKKEITQKFIGKAEEELEDLSQIEQKKEKTKNINPRESDNNFIFYGSDNKFTKQLEIYATLKSTKDLNEIQNPKNKKLVLVIVDSNCPMELLSYKICESFGQFREYQDLDGLTATNLTKNEEENKTLPSEGKVGDVLRNGDIVHVDLLSNEVWIKTNISMINVINRNLKINVTMDVKVKTEMTFRRLKFKLLKSSIICYLDRTNKSENTFHYIVSEFSISTSAHGKLDRNKLLIFDDMKIGQLFDFKNNMKIQIKFYPLEFVLFQKLKAIPIPRPKPNLEKTTKRKIFEKFKKYKKSKFRDLLVNPKFIKEKEYIFNYIKNLFNNKNKDKLSKCYIYSINDDLNINVEDDVDETKIEKFDDEKDISNLNIEAEGGGDIFDMDSELKKSKSNLNKSHRSKNSDSTNNSFREENKESKENKEYKVYKENKITLIILPPIDEENENIENNRISITNKKYSTKQFAFSKFNFTKDTDDEEEEENEEEKEDIYDIQPKKRKNSFFTKLMPKKKTFGNLEFEIIDKKDLIQNNDEMIIYKELKPKEIMKQSNTGNTNKINLCKAFDKYFVKDKFIDFISVLYLMNIQKGTLEKCTIPKFRAFKIAEKSNISLNKKKKKKRLDSYTVTFLNQIFPVKKMNIEIGVVLIFISLMLIFLSNLIFDSYYA